MHKNQQNYKRKINKQKCFETPQNERKRKARGPPKI